mmetsp:Transcript_56967/g.123949  ORF Transcript_56967/g.123949 Transcript_56967/m.123949 type:complete len:257 (-) Transcript_56967:253-1023(-)
MICKNTESPFENMLKKSATKSNHLKENHTDYKSVGNTSTNDRSRSSFKTYKNEDFDNDNDHENKSDNSDISGIDRDISPQTLSKEDDDRFDNGTNKEDKEVIHKERERLKKEEIDREIEIERIRKQESEKLEKEYREKFEKEQKEQRLRFEQELAQRQLEKERIEKERLMDKEREKLEKIEHNKRSIVREPLVEKSEEQLRNRSVIENPKDHKENKGEIVNQMIKKMYNKSPGKINVKRNFMIAQMGEETFKKMIA